MKKISHDLVYPGASVEDVFAMATDPAFRERVADHQGVVRREVKVAGDLPARTVEVEFAHGTDRVPGFARKFVGDEIPIVQVETWTATDAATIEVRIPGKPGDMKGSARIAQRGADVVETVDLAVQVKIPLVGGKIEDLIADLMVKAFKAENKVGLRWLAGDRG